LKQIEVIGKSGRNWPIRDSREQLTMIKSALKASGAIAASAPSTNETTARTRGNSSNAMRDPHASLQLFGSREEMQAAQDPSVTLPYAGSRPVQRGFTDILGDDPDGSHHQATMSPNKAGLTKQQRGFTEILGDEPSDAHYSEAHYRSMSPAKAGAGKNHQPMRLFEGQQEEVEEETPKGKTGKQYIRPNPGKYQHFDFADGSDPADQPKAGVPFDERPKSKHDSQWSFDDFVTPSKPNPSRTHRSEDVRHWDTEETDDAPTQAPGKGRRDAETHFELQDDGESVSRPAGRPRGSTHNEGLGLYKNQLFDQGEPGTPEPQRALGNITNLKDRGKTFEHHFDMADESPAPPPPKQPVPQNRQKAVNMMNANWSSYDESPKAENQRINVAGDGMGSRKGVDPNATRKGYNRDNLAENKIAVAGDGMGGKKGTDRNWLYGGGDVENEEPQPNTSKTRNMRGGNAQSSLWDM
jgi:hypothetical protein